MAAESYAGAAGFFAADTGFATFLQRLAKEEFEHGALLDELIRQPGSPEITSCLTLDADIRHKVEQPFAEIDAQVAAGRLTRPAMICAIAQAEFCEWNELFLCVVDMLAEYGREFQKAVAEIEQHRREIEAFLISLPEGARCLKKVGRLQPVWKRQILVVEDDATLARMVKLLVMKNAEVLIAGDGEEAIELLRNRHFDAVISDIEMPRLNGVELYRQAAEIDAALPRSFIFFTGTRNPEHLQFIRSTKTILLSKPSPISNLLKAVDTLTGTSASPPFRAGASPPATGDP